MLKLLLMIYYFIDPIDGVYVIRISTYP